MIISLIMSSVTEVFLTIIYAFLLSASIKLYRNKICGSGLMLFGSSIAFLMILIKSLTIISIIYSPVEHENFLTSSIISDVLLNTLWIMTFTFGFYRFSKSALQKT